MTKEQIRATSPTSMMRIVPDEDLSNLEDNTAIRKRAGLSPVDLPGIIMELRKHYRDGATDDDHIQLATPGSSIAHLELGTKDL